LERGGKRSATPLWIRSARILFFIQTKAPSPLRSAGALQINAAAHFAPPAQQSYETHGSEVLRLNSAAIASHLLPNRSGVEARSIQSRCAEKLPATDASLDFDRPISQQPWSKPSTPSDAPAIHSRVKKRPSIGRQIVALRRKLFEIRRVRASGNASATPDELFLA
jgi:hypothetical protein